MFRLLTDFNVVTNDIAIGRPEDVEGPRPLRQGDRVLLHDDGEHEAWAIVTRATKDLVGAQIDWSTWADAGTYRLRRREPWVIVTNWDLPGTRGSVGGGSVRLPPRRTLAGRP